MSTEFFMCLIPPTATHQEHKVKMAKGRPVFYEPENVREARANLKAYLAPHRPDKPQEGAVRLVTKWCFPANGKRKNGEYKTTKPDTDNLIKLLKDCMTELGFWKDDALVASEITEKFWADIPGIYVRIEDLEPGD